MDYEGLLRKFRPNIYLDSIRILFQALAVPRHIQACHTPGQHPYGTSSTGSAQVVSIWPLCGAWYPGRAGGFYLGVPRPAAPRGGGPGSGMAEWPGLRGRLHYGLLSLCFLYCACVAYIEQLRCN